MRWEDSIDEGYRGDWRAARGKIRLLVWYVQTYGRTYIGVLQSDGRGPGIGYPF